MLGWICLALDTVVNIGINELSFTASQALFQISLARLVSFLFGPFLLLSLLFVL